MMRTAARVILMALAVVAIVFAGCSHGDDGDSGGDGGGYVKTGPSAGDETAAADASPGAHAPAKPDGPV